MGLRPALGLGLVWSVDWRLVSGFDWRLSLIGMPIFERPVVRMSIFGMSTLWLGSFLGTVLFRLRRKGRQGKRRSFLGLVLLGLILF